MSAPERESLPARLLRFPADRYPVQHATTQFQHGTQLLHAGRTSEALAALGAALEGFQRAGLALEQAKSLMMLGAALRSAGALDRARAACTAAAAELGRLQQSAEQAAALHNLGLVEQAAGRGEPARHAWAQARSLFSATGQWTQAAASAREIGASRLAQGDPAGARTSLTDALELAEQAGDQAGAGLAANALGLAMLGVDDPAGAVQALRRAQAAFPRTVRPAEFAMTTANLALAYAHDGATARARLAARQALALPAAAGPVRGQARALLDQLGGTEPARGSVDGGRQAAADLAEVLAHEPQEGWSAVLREEVLRALDLPPTGRRELIGALLGLLVSEPDQAYELGESLLSVVLELPPSGYDALVTTVVDALAVRPSEHVERVQTVLASSLARFAMPQWQRLVASLNAAAQTAGQPQAWR